ncbi:hypothetical protein [Pectobacterium zantedeschiae]|uniref:hypothetical protein n=1 Tax=Pectobacterium zantedeschiae TaxID=2034769 RepID=UPI0018D519AA|nr:hypothetical protein [Pectobacterium zantedeschiae]
MFKALQYQLLVAVEYCHDLTPAESLWIEVSGDVTVPGKVQTEVKNYSDNLTDSHANFWNTLKNWMHENFERTSFKSLVLLTTQEFGSQSELKSWNERSTAERLEIMENIFVSSQTGATKRKAKKTTSKSSDDDETAKPTKSQSLQQYVMAPEHRDKLMEILERMHITVGADSLEQRIQNYQTRHLTMIRPTKYQQFIDDLLGFMCSTKLVSEGWQISHQDFSAKFTELTHRYIKHPKKFPLVDMDALKKTINIEEIKPMLFALKITQIGGECVLKTAALHRVVTQTVISELYSDGVLSKSDVDSYFNNHLILHQNGRNSAMLDCTGVTSQMELNKHSMRFYYDRNGMAVEPFCGMEHTQAEFRNGVYHLLAGEEPEDQDDEFHWRLW